MRLGQLFLFTLVSISIAATATAEPRHRRSNSGADAVKMTTPQTEAPRSQEMTTAPESHRGMLRFDAFFEPQFRFSSKDEMPLDKGFSLNDAAVYMTKDFGRGMTGLIELPFASQYSANSGPATQFSIPANRAQAYFKFEKAPLAVKFGQYATPFGVEMNDSRDRFFADMGLIKSTMLPTTQQGVSVGAGIENFSFSVMGGNLPDIGATSGAASQTNQNFAFGAQGRFDAAKGYAAVGVLTGDDKNQTTEKNKLIVDVMGGVKMDRLRLDASFDNVHYSGLADAATGFGIFAMYDVPQYDMGIGGRLEFINKPLLATPGTAAGALGPAGSTRYDSAMEVSVGPAYHFTQDLTLRGDLTFANMKASDAGKAAGAEDASPFGISFSILASL